MTFNAKTGKTADFIQDENNASVGSERGAEILNWSFSELLAGRSIVVDKNGKIIAGNKAQLAALAEGFEDAIIVQSDGRRLIVHQRIDLDLDDETGDARLMAFADNRSTDFTKIDLEIAQESIDLGLDLSTLFTPQEIEYFPMREEEETAVETDDTTQAIIDELTGELWNDEDEKSADADEETADVGDVLTCPKCGHNWRA